MGPRTRPPESAARVGERHGGPDCAPRICITSRSQARRDHRRTDSSVSVSAEAEASSSLFQPHHGGRDPTSPLASASRRGCCINPRPAHWSRSKDGVEKAEARARPWRVLPGLDALSPLSGRHSERGPGFRRRLCATATVLSASESAPARRPLPPRSGHESSDIPWTTLGLVPW